MPRSPRSSAAASRSVRGARSASRPAAGSSSARSSRRRDRSTLRLVATGELLPMTRRDPAGLFEVACSTRPRRSDGDPRLPAAHHLSRRSRRRDRRSVSLRPRAHRFRSAPVRRRARTTARSRSSARTASRSARRPACTSRCGRRTPIASASIGDFNGWDGRVHPMRLLVPAGIWEIFIPDLPDGEKYKFEIRTRHGRAAEEDRSVRRRVRGAAADRVDRPRHLAATQWRDDDVDGGARRRTARWLDRPMSIYEVHLGSWARVPEEGNRFLTYRELARPARAVREGDGLHAHRAAAGDGASVLRIVGLSGARVLRADQPLRPAGGLQAVSSTPATRPASA